MTASLQAKFETFHAKHPKVYELFDHTCHELISRGYKRFAAIAIITRIVWQMSELTTGELYKINTAYAAYYARHWLSKNTEHPNFFKLKKLKGSDKPEDRKR